MTISNFIKIIPCCLILIIPTRMIAQKKEKTSKTVQISEHEYVLDCSNYEYQLTKKASFVGGKEAVEKLLLQSFKKETLVQNGESPDCDLTIRLFPYGRTQLMKTDALKSKYRKKVIGMTKQIFLGNNKWIYPVFIGKPRKYIDVEVGVLLDSKRIEYDAIVLMMDPCESTIYRGNIKL